MASYKKGTQLHMKNNTTYTTKQPFMWFDITVPNRGVVYDMGDKINLDNVVRVTNIEGAEETAEQTAKEYLLRINADREAAEKEYKQRADAYRLDQDKLRSEFIEQMLNNEEHATVAIHDTLCSLDEIRTELGALSSEKEEHKKWIDFEDTADGGELDAINDSITAKEKQLSTAKLAFDLKNTLDITQCFRPELQKMARALRTPSHEIDLNKSTNVELRAFIRKTRKE
jgi:hypothetical protein